MSLPDVPNHGLQDEEEDDEFVETRSEPLAWSHRHHHANASVGTHKTPISWAEDRYEVPVVGGEGPFSPVRNLPHPPLDDDSFFPPSLDANTPNHTRAPPQKKDSFRDWLAAGAVDFLKATGGVALTTTEFLVSPPLQMTRLLLPGLLASLLEYIDLVTPPRCKDWFRIVSSSVYHVISVLKHTAKGKDFRTQLGNVGGDLRELMSSDVVRQVLMDGMASNVKMAEALHTPEMHAWLEQLSVLGCRLVDAASSGTNKQLIHDLHELVWSGVEVLADPHSTLALAEVTAYLCHALEMEDALPRPEENMGQINATRRYQRNAQQSHTYGTQTQVLQDPDATVEQVILSSLGNHTIGREDAANGNGNFGSSSSSIPTNVVFTDDTENDDAHAHAKSATSLDWGQQGAQLQNQVNIPYLQQKMEQRAQHLRQENRRTTTNPLSSSPSKTPVVTNQASKGGVGWGSTSSHCAAAATDASSSRLPTRTIPDLPNTKNENGNKTDTNDANHMDMEDLVVETETVEEDDYRTKPAPKPRPQPGDPLISSQQTQHPKHRLEGETSVMHFYRILDEVLQEKRESRVNELLGSVNVDSNVDANTEPPQLWYPRAAAAAGAGNERGQETMKRRLASLKSRAKAAGKASEIGVGSSASTTTASVWPKLRDFVNQRQPQTATKSKAFTDLTAIYNQYKSLILVGVGVAAFMAWIVSAFAMYGMYKFFFPAGLGWTLPFLGLFSYPNIPRILQESTSTTPLASSSSEIVIRVIRQVVHVNQDGTILEQLVTDPIASAATSSTENLDDIAQCVAASLDSTDWLESG